MKTIFVFDDEPEFAEVVGMQAESPEHTVRVFTSANEMIPRLREADLVISDCTGHEAVHAAVRDQGIQLIRMSGDPAILPDLNKPFTGKQIRDLIREKLKPAQG